MKWFFAIPIVSFLTCCDDKGQHFDHSDVIGQYKVTEWNAPVPVDLNQDGISSRNLLDESNCFDDAEITLFSDGTFVKIYRSILIVEQFFTCNVETWTGIWTRTGDRLTLTWQTDQGMVSDIYNFGSVNERLTRTIEDANYPNIDDDGHHIYETGNVNVIFTKTAE